MLTWIVAVVVTVVTLAALAALAGWLLRRRGESTTRLDKTTTRPPVTSPGRTIPAPRPRQPVKIRNRPPDESWRARPQPGEIWWADVPFDDGTGSKVRPCLVLRTHRTMVEVLKITSQDRRARWDHVEIPTRSWDHDADHNSFLDLTDPYRIKDSEFKNRAGTLDAGVWIKVKKLHRTGWVA